MRIFCFLLVFHLFACDDEGSGGSTITPVVPEISIAGVEVRELEEDFDAMIEVTLSESTEAVVSVNLEANSKTATAGEDFEALSTTVQFAAGETKKSISITIKADDENEIQEAFTILLSDPSNGTIKFDQATILITDGDEATYSEDGYTTDATHAGYELAWADEFDGDQLDESSWTYELGNGCNINLCGWGNNELQTYSDTEENSLVKDGSLKIIARNEGQLTSARIITKGKREFRFGRIDIRAKLPKGQGIWPAIWMLGSNIDQVSWPACGEIDIMELVGHEANKSHGTAHWGNAGEGSQFQGNSFGLSEDFSERFHVFTLLWKNNSLQWYVDETPFHIITADNTSGYTYPFNNNFFFIMNVAVGGNWPGSPDETTVFPQTMEVDYIRVFQEN